MFHDDSINIHYRTPTSKLLKMNTFNEFELSRMRKFYKDELACRLQRSKSSRLPARQAAPRVGSDRKGPTGAGTDTELDHSSYLCKQGRQAHSAERLPMGAGRRQFRDSAPGDSPFVDLNRYQHALSANEDRLRRHKARFGRALFDFQAKNEPEISLKRGDLVEILEVLEHSWARVEDCQSGLQGLAPLSYIDYSVGCAVAKRDVPGQQGSRSTSGEAQLLPMSKGEPITLLRRIKGHWYEATNTRQVSGLVWSNDLDIIKQPVLADEAPEKRANQGAGRGRTNEASEDEFTEYEYDEAEQEEEEEERIYILNSGENVLVRRRPRSASNLGGQPSKQLAKVSAGGYGKIPCEGHCCTMKLGANHQTLGQLPRRSSSSPYISALRHETARDERQAGPMGAEQVVGPSPWLCRAKFAYSPRQKDELELRVGEVLLVLHECDDGWFIGSSYSTKQTGTFPGNFVEPT